MVNVLIESQMIQHYADQVGKPLPSVRPRPRAPVPQRIPQAAKSALSSRAELWSLRAIDGLQLGLTEISRRLNGIRDLDVLELFAQPDHPSIPLASPRRAMSHVAPNGHRLAVAYPITSQLPLAVLSADADLRLFNSDGHYHIKGAI